MVSKLKRIPWNKGKKGVQINARKGKKYQWINVICKKCGKNFQARVCYLKRGQMKYCSLECSRPIGKNNPRWTGGRKVTFQGYLQIYSPDHPYKNHVNRVSEHRLVMEKHLGRFLNPKERIHHINGIKTDNRIENLHLFANESDHQKYGHPKSRKHNNTL